jgi:tetratricopeptide (TPR) repeat protein
MVTPEESRMAEKEPTADKAVEEAPGVEADSPGKYDGEEVQGLGLEQLAFFSRQKKIRQGLLRRITAPSSVTRLVDGLNFLISGNPARALMYLRQASEISDALFMSGYLSLREGDLESAEADLLAAPSASGGIGSYFRRFGFEPELRVLLHHGASCAIPLDRFGAMLALCELYRRKPDLDKALEVVEDVNRLAPELMLARVMLAEILDLNGRDDPDTLDRTVRLGRAIENRGSVHAALLYYKGKALRKLGVLSAALETLELAQTGPKRRPEDLIKAVRYERAVALLEKGDKLESRQELERIYAEDPDYMDVRDRLGV